MSVITERAARMRPRLLSLALFCIAAHGCSFEVETDSDSDVQSAVENMLAESAVAWNEGRLDGFMDDYVESPGTTYIGGGGLLVGYEAIRDRYAPLFEPGSQRDSLRFEDVRVRRLAAIEAIATARWVLHRGGEITGSGPFTLVLRHTSGGWKIIHDHSSSDPAPPPADEPS
jgi:ketosteroid isomerase-like protein